MGRVKITTKDGERLLEFINNSESAELRASRITEIACGCMVTRQVVYNWMFGKTRIPALHKQKIEEVLGVSIFLEFADA